jgi:membrane protein implicated in regulation of membrane protease activity
MRRALIAIGLLLVVAGLLWPWLSQLPFGRLPGDIMVDKPGFKLYLPITTMVLLSVLLSALLWLFRR